jgi:hypothetical protein
MQLAGSWSEKTVKYLEQLSEAMSNLTQPFHIFLPKAERSSINPG